MKKLIKFLTLAMASGMLLTACGESTDVEIEGDIPDVENPDEDATEEEIEEQEEEAEEEIEEDIQDELEDDEE